MRLCCVPLATSCGGCRLGGAWPLAANLDVDVSLNLFDPTDGIGGLRDSA
jgi:hypothetical protein